jgi:HSP20 family molecular chaperone IbpA
MEDVMTTQNTEMARRPQEQLEHVRDEQRVMPPVDVYENDDEILLLVDVPGVAQDGLDVQLEGGRLDLEARQSALPEGDPGQPLLFARSFSVPNTVDPAKVAAELDMGVLKIHLPKGEAAKPRRIQVKAS